MAEVPPLFLLSKSLLLLQVLAELSLRISVYIQQVLQLVNNVKLVEPP